MFGRGDRRCSESEIEDVGRSRKPTARDPAFDLPQWPQVASRFSCWMWKMVDVTRGRGVWGAEPPSRLTKYINIFSYVLTSSHINLLKDIPNVNLNIFYLHNQRSCGVYDISYNFFLSPCKDTSTSCLALNAVASRLRHSAKMLVD